jgi:import inner membrane translocase subunit TIM54
MPKGRLKLPSRNWSIFLGVVSGFATLVWYDRQQKRRVQQKWCALVQGIAAEPLDALALPRRVTVYLAAPPGDGLRAARAHFAEYVKPILVAGALDWDVVEGRREGDVRAALAARIRRARRKAGEKAAAATAATAEFAPEDGFSAAAPRPAAAAPRPAAAAPGGSGVGAGAEQEEEEEDVVEMVRRQTGVREWPGVKGDIIIGRHTWKEYIRGLHEGWLGPLNLPAPAPPPEELAPDKTDLGTGTESELSANPESPAANNVDNSVGESGQNKRPAPSSSPSPSFTPYISTDAYPSATTLPPSIPDAFDPAVPIPFPHLLGFFNTPIRIYRFLTRRHLADRIGRDTAAAVIANYSRPYTSFSHSSPSSSPSSLSSSSSSSSPSASSAFDNTDFLDNGASSSSLSSSPSLALAEYEEIRTALFEEEKDWDKSVRQRQKVQSSTSKPEDVPDGDGPTADADASKKRDSQDAQSREYVWTDDVVLDVRIIQRMRRFELSSLPAGDPTDLDN